MYFGKDPENMKYLIGNAIDKAIFLQNPSPECPYMPETIHIEPVGRCNINCIHCVRKKITREEGVMTVGQFKAIIDKIYPYKCNVTIGRNGEPLLHKEIVEMIRYAKSKNLFTSMITNAIILSCSLGKEIIKAGLDRIVFSFDSVDKEVYESIRRGAKFEKTLKNILFFLKENFAAGLPVHTAVSWTATKKAKESPTDISAYFRNFPVNDVYRSSLQNMFGDTEVDYEFDSDVNRGRAKKDWPICVNSWSRLGVQWNGTVVACVSDFDDRYVIGNIFHESLPQIWNGPAMKKFRKGLIDRDYRDIEKKGSLCSKCSAKWESGFDARMISDTVKQFFFREISARENPPRYDEDKRYQNLLMELRKHGWLE